MPTLPAWPMSITPINREVHRIETDVEPASDEVLEDLKKKRLHLKDQIAALLAAAANTAS